MTEEKKTKVIELATDAHRKRELVKGMSASAVPTDPVAKEKQAVAFAIAMTESVEADALLRAEMGV